MTSEICACQRRSAGHPDDDLHVRRARAGPNRRRRRRHHDAGDEKRAGRDEFGDTVSVTQQMCRTVGPTCPDIPGDDWTTLTQRSTVLDVLGHVVARADSTLGSDGTPESTATTTYQPDLAGDVLSMTEPAGSTTASSYDALGRTTSSTTDGIATTHAYDGLGRETVTVEPGFDGSTLTTHREFDADGNLVERTEDDSEDQSSSRTMYTYNSLVRLWTTTGPTGLLTTRTYDALGRQTKLVAGDSVTDTTYDKAGRAVAVVGAYTQGEPPAEAPTTTSVFDALGRQRPETTLDGTTTTYYNAAGDEIATVDEDGAVTRTAVNILGEAVRIVENCTDTGSDPPADPATCTGSGTSDGSTNITSTTTYSATGAILKVTHVRAGVTSETTFDGAGRDARDRDRRRRPRAHDRPHLRHHGREIGVVASGRRGDGDGL